MKQSIMANIEADEWLQKLKSIPAASINSYISTEDARMTADLYAVADELHAAMAAWHSLATPARVTSLFRQIDDHIGNITRSRGGWLNSLLRLRDFISDVDGQPAFPEETLAQLDEAYQSTMIYQQRLQSLADSHIGALQAYKAWITALACMDASEVPAQPDVLRSGILSRSVEALSAQQQLTQMVALQQQSLQAMSTDILHITATARSLAKNRESAGRLQKDQYQKEMKRLRQLLGSRS